MGTEDRAVAEEVHRSCQGTYLQSLLVDMLVGRSLGKHFSVQTLERSIFKPNISWRERIVSRNVEAGLRGTCVGVWGGGGA